MIVMRQTEQRGNVDVIGAAQNVRWIFDVFIYE